MSLPRVPLVVFALAILAPLQADEPRRDLAGDPLPGGAIARLGTVRWRAGSTITLSAFLPDGKSLLTVCQDFTVIVWDLETGKELRSFSIAGNKTGDPGIVFRNAMFAGTAAVSANGKVVACAGRDGVMRAFDVSTGKLIAAATAPNQLRVTRSVALSRDGKILAGANQEGGITLWDIGTNAEPKALGPANSAGNRAVPFYRLDFSDDGKTLLYAAVEFNNNGGIQTIVITWDVAGGKELRRKAMPSGVIFNQMNVMRCAISPDHKRFAIPDAGAIHLIDLESEKQVKKLEDFGTQQNFVLLFSSDSKTLVGMNGKRDGIGLWDAADGKPRKQFGTLADPKNQQVIYRYPSSESISPDGKTLAWADGPALVLTDLETGKPRPGPVGHTGGLKNAIFAPDGKTVFTRGSDAAILRWDPENGKLLGRIDVPGQNAVNLLSNDGRLIVTGENIGVIRVFDAASAKELRQIEMEFPNYGFTFSLSPDAKTLAVVGRIAPTMQLYNLADGKKRLDLALPAPPDRGDPNLPRVVNYGVVVRRILFTADSRYIGIATDGYLTVFDAALGRELHRLKLPDGQILRYAALSPDARTVALEFHGGAASVWELATGSRRQSLSDGKAIDFADPNAMVAMRLGIDGVNYPMTLAYSDDGRLLARGGEDGVIRVWDLRTSQEIGSFSGHRGSLVSLCFSPDGRRLLTASSDTTAIVWDAAPLRERLSTKKIALEPDRLDAMWVSLKDADGAKAYAAILALAGDPDHTVSFLSDRVKPIQVADTKLVAKLVTDLGDRSFAVREKARNELERLGELAGPALRDAAASAASAEARQMARRLLETLAHRALPLDQVRMLRAIEALELAGTSPATDLLKRLAGGAAESAPTVAAQAAVQRANERSKP
jgi:WD40 repeat protein